MAAATPHADEYPEALRGDSKPLPEHAGDRRAEVDGRALASAGEAGAERCRAREKLHDGVGDRHSARVLAQPLQDVGDPRAAAVFREPGQRQPDERGAGQRQGDLQHRVESLEAIAVSVEQDQGRAVERQPEQGDHDPGDAAGRNTE